MQRGSAWKTIRIWTVEVRWRFPTRSGCCSSVKRDHVKEQTLLRGCAELLLDAGYTRHDAHRSYLRRGFDMTCHHMAWQLHEATR